MNSAEGPQAHHALLSRCDAIADSWYKAVTKTSYVPLGEAQVRSHFATLTEGVIALLLADSFERGQAEAIGASLASLHYIEPEALGRTQEVLVQQTAEGLPADQVVALQPRLAGLLGGLTTGFFRQSRETVLIEQEKVRSALTTALQQAQEALRESEERLRLVVQNMPVMLDALDADNDIVAWNRECEQVTGYSADEIIGNPKALELLYPDKAHLQRVLAEWAERSDAFRDWELELTSKDGNVKTVSWSNLSGLFPIPGWHLWAVGVDITERKRAEGELRKARDELERRVEERTAELVKSNEQLRREIAERKQAEEALQESEERFRGIFENATIGLYRTSPDGHILMANPALLRMMGYSSFDELAQRNLEEEGYEPEYPRSAFKQRIRNEGQVLGLESAWVRRDGITLFIRESARAIRDEAGNTLYYEGTVEDITERKRAEEEIRQRNRELAALNAIAATVNQSLDLDEVLSEALDKVLVTLGLEAGSIHLLDERSNTLNLKIHRGVDLSGEVVESISQDSLTAGPWAEVVATGKPLVQDISAHPIVEQIEKRDLKSVAMIPLQSKEQVLGTMQVVSIAPHQFTSEEIRLLTSVGQQVGVAIENARLYRKAQLSAAQSASLFEISQSLISSLDMDRTLRLIVRHAATLLGTDICRLFLYDPDTDELLGQMICGVSDEDSSRARVPLSQIRTAVEAKTTLQPVVVQDTSQDHRMPDDIVEKWGIKSSLTIPLVAEGRFLGIIFLSETGAHRRFTASEIELTQNFASQAAIALQNAQLFAQAEQLAMLKERNRMASEIHDSLAQNLASLLMKIDFCLGLIDSDPQATKVTLVKLKAFVRGNIADIRYSIFALRHPGLEELGFLPALRKYAQAFGEQTGVPVDLSIVAEEVESQLPPVHEYALFRIIQEALNNVKRHARAKNVWIVLDLSAPDAASLTVSDDGLGFDQAVQEIASLTWLGGFGLAGMKERAKTLGGRLVVESEPGSGTKITATLPVNEGR